jgi:hypothetical protein
VARAIILASPFIIGFVWSFISSVLVERLAGKFEARIKKELQDTGYGEGASDPDAVGAGLSVVVPLVTSPRNLRTYVDWLVDAPQLLPTILLSAVGVVVAIAEDRDLILTYIVCGVAAVIGAITTYVIMRMHPQEYSGGRRIWIFTIGTFIAAATNFAAAVIVIVGVATRRQ